MAGLMLTIVPFNENEKERTNTLLDAVINRLKNGISLVPSEDEIQAAKKAGIDCINNLINQSSPKDIRRLVELADSLEHLEKYFEKSADVLKIYDERERDHVLKAAELIKEQQQCPEHLSSRLHRFEPGLPELVYYVEMVCALAEECQTLADMGDYNSESDIDELAGLAKFKARGNNELARTVLPYILGTECRQFVPWGTVVFKDPNQAIYYLDKDTDDAVRIKITDTYLMISIFKDIPNQDIDEMNSHLIGWAKFSFNDEGNLYYEDKADDKINLDCWEIIKQHPSLYNIFKICYMLLDESIEDETNE